ncbi:hypothetical protein LXL04_021910 [Taraxacum kok-saghyz]
MYNSYFLSWYPPSTILTYIPTNRQYYEKPPNRFPAKAMKPPETKSLSRYLTLYSVYAKIWKSMETKPVKPPENRREIDVGGTRLLPEIDKGKLFKNSEEAEMLDEEHC